MSRVYVKVHTTGGAGELRPEHETSFETREDATDHVETLRKTAQTAGLRTTQLFFPKGACIGFDAYHGNALAMTVRITLNSGAARVTGHRGVSLLHRVARQ